MSDGFRRVVRARRLEDDRAQLEAELQKLTKDDLVELVANGGVFGIFRPDLSDLKLFRLRRASIKARAAADMAYASYSALGVPRGIDRRWDDAREAWVKADDRASRAHAALMAHYDERTEEFARRAQGVPAAPPTPPLDRAEEG